MGKSAIENETVVELGPNENEVTYVLDESDKEFIASIEAADLKTENNNNGNYKIQIAWISVFKIILLHVGAILGFLLIPSAHNLTIVFSYVLILMTMLGVQVGAHRLWSHRSFKANFGLRLFLSICFLVAQQNDIYEWCRDHRAHHKFSETDADPHNANRGFFFSHMGWLMCRKHPEVIRRGSTIDMSDLLSDRMVMFQRRYYFILVIFAWAIIPTIIPVLLWNESLANAFLICSIHRYTVTLHVTWLVNSWAHIWGDKPYNQKIAPVEATIRHVLVGEGFHNYHHSFPWDYSASELGSSSVFNPATAVINFFHACGWVWDLKRADPALVALKIESVGNMDQRYKSSWCRFFIEWISGLVTITFPLYTMFIIKYGYLFFCNCTLRQEPWIELYGYTVL